MIRRFALPLFILVLLIAPAAAGDLPEATRTAIRSFVAEEMQKHQVPGLSLAVVSERQLCFSAGFGKADIENDVPAKPDTVYRLASISKTITAVAAMQLVEQGKLDLEAPIQKYVPGFPKKEWPITIRHLLCHQSGIRHYTRDGKLVVEEFNSTRHFDRLIDGLAMFQSDALLHEPGAKFSYTTHGYTLLGCAVESAAGKPYLQCVRENICLPAGMATLRDDDPSAIIRNRAQGYRKTPSGEFRNSGLADTSYKIPGGGFCGTAQDLAKFAMALQNGKLVRPETRTQMFTPQKTNDGKATSYGLGWVVSKRGQWTVIMHSGAQQRVSTHLAMIPDRGFAVALMCNLEGCRLDGVAARIAQIVLDAK